MDDLVENLDHGEPAAPAWQPSSALREQLQAGMLAAFLAGGLSMASAGAELAQPKAAGWGLADNLAWAALLPLGLVLRAYLTLGREIDSFALRKSASCLLGTVVLVHVFDLATQDILPLGWQIAVWLLFGLGALALLGGLFAAETGASPPGAEPATGVTRSGKAGVLGGVAAAVLVVLKLAGNGLMAKFFALRLIAVALRNLHGARAPLVFYVLLLQIVVLQIWLAGCKIRQRRTLGSVAAGVGWAEIVLVVGLFITASYLIAAYFTGLDQPGLNQQAHVEIQAETDRRFALLSLLASGMWTGLTAFLFLNLRGQATHYWREEAEQLDPPEGEP